MEAYRADAVLAALAAAGEAIGITVTLPTTTTSGVTTPPLPVESMRTAAPIAESTGLPSHARPRVRVRLRQRHLPSRPRLRPPTSRAAERAVRRARAAAGGASRSGEVERPILVDAIALKRGYATATETCEILGFGPVDARWVRQILPEALVDVLVHDLIDIKAHATITRHQKRALESPQSQRPALRRPRLQTPASARSRPPPRLRQAGPHRVPEHGTALRRPPRREDPPRRPHRTHHHRLALVPTTTRRPANPSRPPGSIPWRAPVGEHLTAFDLTDLPPPELDDATAPRRQPDGTLPFE